MPKGIFKNPVERAEKISRKLIGHKINLGRKRPLWVRKKLSESKKGDKNPNWKNGISKDKSYWCKIEYARKKNACGRFSTSDWENLKKQYNYTCLCCKKSEPEIKLTVDHIIPLSKGGSNYIDNVQPLCNKCNSKKHAKIEGQKFNTASLVAGAGEIGMALYNILKKEYQTYIIDENSKCFEPITYLHICFPFSDKFVEEVKKYQKEYKPNYTIIHSTVPVGTCRKLGAISSPCIGIHPHLEQSLKTFVKYLGGEQASEVADYFRRCGMKVYLFDNPETSELMKILDTTHYGVEIEYFKEVKRQCQKYNVPFEAWTLWVRNYNEGYKKLGYSEYVKPDLTPIMTEIKGHCVLQNTELLDTPFTKFIKELNEKAGS